MLFRTMASTLYTGITLGLPRICTRHLTVAGASGLGQADGFQNRAQLARRAPTCGSYILERKACHELGLTLVDFPIRSRAALERQTWLAACAIFDRLEYPVFMHCKAGADRTGLMAVLYLHLKRGVDLATARDNGLRYGHIRQAKTGIIDYFYDQFTAEGATRGQTLPEYWQLRPRF